MSHKYNDKRNSRTDTDSDGDWFDVMYKMGMPLLYILALSAGITGTICMGVITEYWSNLEPAMCFLYAKTASSSVVYTFGSSLAVCNWVTYGAVVAIIIAFFAGIVYTVLVREGAKDVTPAAAFSVAAIILAMLLMLGVTCTMAEGMRITCTSMGLNSANNKGESCYEKLDKRVLGEQLPIQTSTMVRAALISLIVSTVLLFVITCFHLSDFYRRTLRQKYRTVHVDYDGRH